jgi:hypothetical protein
MGNGYIMDKGTKCYNIKSQGDNLIDVLEDKDLIVEVYTKENDETYTLYEYKGIGVDRYKKQYVITNTSVKFYEEDLHLKETYIGNNDTTEFKIITHEQYMKLAQEVI